MDFSRYIIVSSYFVTDKLWWLPIVCVGAFFAVVFALQAIALYTVASRSGYKNKWMAFVPFLSTYYIGVCAQKNKIFNRVDARIFSAVAAVMEFLLLGGSIVYYVAILLLARSGCLEITINEMTSMVLAEIVGSIPNNLFWAEWCFNNLYDYILSWFSLLFMFVQVLLLSAFFQTYSARRYFIFTVASALFPIQGIIFFIIRNNKGYNYREYLRLEQERRYRTYQQFQQQNFSQNPYNQNPYSRNGESGPYGGYDNRPSGGVKPEDPFAEFGGSSRTDNSDPFDDN